MVNVNISYADPVDGKVPDGPPSTAWARRRDEYKLVSPLNRRKFKGSALP